MMRAEKIIRSKTQKKESRSHLPQLKPTKRLLTLNVPFTPNQTRKLSQNYNDKTLPKKNKRELKKSIDQNYLNISLGKNAIKFSKKKFNNQFMTISQINNNLIPSMRPSTPSNITQFISDQYQGMRDYNEDRILNMMNVKILGKNYNIFGVFDGHGGAGSSQYCKSNFVSFFNEQMNETPLLSVLQNLRKCIRRLEDKITQLSKSKNIVGGTCASIIIFCQDQYFIAHVGDSRILRIKCNQSKYQIQQITTDHKPDDTNEKNRIQSVGGKIYRNKTKLPDGTQVIGPYRVFPGRLSVSRTIGDYDAKKQPNGQAISWEPQLIQGKIQQKNLFLLYTDGAYEKFNNTEIADFFIKQKSLNRLQMKKSIQLFLLNSLIKESTDNISIISIISKPINQQNNN